MNQELNKKQIAALKKLLLTKSGKVNKTLIPRLNILDLVLNVKMGVYEYYNDSYNRKIATNLNYDFIANLLRILDVNYKVENDAPRGGKCGWHLVCLRKHKFDLIEFIKIVEGR